MVKLTCGLAATACGYNAVYGSAPSSRLHVKLVRTLIADAIASDEVATGLREELARAGVLEAGDGYPRVEVEVLRADEASEGIGAAPGKGGPRARATDLGVTARAWIVRAEGAPPESDTGDLRTEETLAVDEDGRAGQVAQAGTANLALDPRASAFHEADALRAAARRLGRKLAFRITGEPAASEGPSGP